MKTNSEGRYLIDNFKDEYLPMGSRTAAEKAANSLIRVRLNNNQFSSLVSFIMSIGIVNFRKSLMLQLMNESRINRHILLLAADEFDKYIYQVDDNNQRFVDPFLIDHRQKEKKLFLKPELVPKRKS